MWTGKDSVDPHDGLIRAVRDAGADRPLFSAEIAKLLTSRDVRERTGAVALTRDIVPDVGVAKIAAILADNEAMFRGVKPAWRIEHEDLEQVLAIGLSSQVKAGDAAGIAILRRLAPARPWGFYLLEPLARVDAEWLVTNAKGLVPHDHLGVLGALDARRQERLIDALKPYPPEKPTFFTKAFWNRQSPADAKRLRSRMWPGSV